ncbi:MAG: XisI protein [Planctomycetes bacterium]|nr:XisI protein [Planctomycetota bacterium]MBL7041777.1 XisI protein [Pirellulaceae bacterium]
MDRMNEYRQLLEQVLRDHPAHPPGRPVETRLVVDRERDDYLLLDVGWGEKGRVHCLFAHLRLRDGKVWIEKDGTERGFAVELVEAGIPKEDIVLAFYRPQQRKLTDYAVA